MRSAWLLVVACIWLLPSTVLAQRVVVRSFEGPGAARVREAVLQALAKEGAERVREAEADAAAAANGSDLSSASGRVAVARKLKLAAFVEGEVSKKKKQLEAHLRVFNGRDGALLGEASFHAAKDALPRRVQKEFSAELGSALARARTPEAAAEPEPEPEPTRPQARDDEQPRRRSMFAEQGQGEPHEAEPEPEAQGGPHLAALELGAAVRVMTRHYSYVDPLLMLGVHSLRATPALRLEARWYPGAHFTRGFAANLGLDLQGQLMWPVSASSLHIPGASFKTNSTAFGLGLRLRIPIGEHQLGVLAGYGGQSLALADSKGLDPGLPSVAYDFARMGGDGRFALSSRFSLGVRAAYLLLLGYGELAQSEWFAHASGGGIEAELTLGYSVSELIAFNLGGGMTRYFLSLNPEPKDTGVAQYGRIAGGVTDQYIYGVGGITLSL